MLAVTVAFILTSVPWSAVRRRVQSPSRGPTPATPTLRFDVVTKTRQKLDSIVWTGRQFLYVQNTANTVWAAPLAGHPLTQFATMPKLVEETRCVLSPGSQGFPPGGIFCQSPDNKIYEISPNGASVTVFATLPAPYPPASDGALAFDKVGRFGYRLVAATGRSGSREPAGGVVYTIDSHRQVQRVGSYAGPGGADGLVIAPSGFGSVAGDALLTVDVARAAASSRSTPPAGRERSRPSPKVPIRSPRSPAPAEHRDDWRSHSGPVRE